MALQTFVKINQVTNLTDARYCSGMMVDLLGFSLDPNQPNYISPDQFKEITGWVSGVEFVAEFTGNPSFEIADCLKNYPEIHWVEMDQLEALTLQMEKGHQGIYRVKLEEASTLSEHKSIPQELLLHLQTDKETLTEEEKNTIQMLSERFRVILGGGFQEENILSLLKELNLYGISLDGGKEIKAGLRDFDQMADILEKLEIED